MFSLGRLCEQGEGLPRDRGEALGWYRKAAALGMAEAGRRVEELAGEGRLSQTDAPL